MTSTESRIGVLHAGETWPRAVGGYRCEPVGGATGTEACEIGTDHRVVCSRGGMGCYLRHNRLLEAAERVRRVAEGREGQ